jgi:hypothetical protein
MAADHRYLSMSSLSRRPVLIAMLVYSMAYGVAAWAVWRDATSTSISRECETQGFPESIRPTETRELQMYDGTRHLSI